MTAADRLRVMTLNLWHTPTAVDERLAAVAAEVRARRPHVLCLQEVAVDDAGRSRAHDLAERTGLTVAALGGVHLIGALGERSGVAVLTSLPVEVVHQVELPAGRPRGAVVVEMSAPSGRPLVVATTHLAWGGRQEAVRCAQVAYLDEFLYALPAANTPGAVTVLTGDFNTVPDADSIRFLTGLGAHAGKGTFWTDAWAVAGSGPGETSGPDNPWAAVTAAQVGIADPARLPRRRIDYVLVRDWAHGRPGCPLAARRAFTQAHPAEGAAGVHASDHWGVEADLWDPPLA